MPLVPAKCTSCGDVVQVDKDKDAAVCPSCGSAFIVEKAVNNYGTMISGDNISVNVGDGVEVAKLLDLSLDQAVMERYDEGITSIDRAQARGDIGQIFRCVRSTLGAASAFAKGRVDRDGLQLLLDNVMKAWPILVNKSDTAVDERQTKRAFNLLISGAQSGWQGYLDKLGVLLKDKSKWADTVEGLIGKNSEIALLLSFIEWGRQNRFFLAAPCEGELDARLLSVWTDIALGMLEAVTLCYHSGLFLSASGVQFVYDCAKWLAKLKPSGYKLPPRLAAPAEGGDGVHCYLVDGRSSPLKTFISVKLRQELQEFPSLSGNPAYIVSILLLLSPFIAVWSMVLFFFWLLCTAAAAFILAQRQRNGSNLERIGKLYLEWKSSPAHGTATEKLSYDIFREQIDESVRYKLMHIRIDGPSSPGPV